MRKSNYLLRKITFAVAIIVGVVIFNFFLFRIMPSDPIKLIFNDPRISKESQDQLRESFGLDKPVWFDKAKFNQGDLAGAFFDTQFSAYVNSLLHGKLGISFTRRVDVKDLLVKRVGNSLLLALSGSAIAIILGIIFGLLSAWKRGSRLDIAFLLTALFTTSLPAFFLGIVLIIFAGRFFSFGGMTSAEIHPSDGMAYWIDLLKHLALPAITLAIVEVGSFFMVMRSSVVDILSDDFILTAKAKGFNDFQILKDHAFKNAMLPMTTIIALNLAYTVAGSIQIETVFSWPGIGRLMFEAVHMQDFPVLQGAFLLIAISVVLANLLADMLYSLLDPRVSVD